MGSHQSRESHAAPEALPGHMGVTLLHLLKTAAKLKRDVKFSLWYPVMLELQDFANVLDDLVMDGHGSYFSEKLMADEFMKDRNSDYASDASTDRALQEIGQQLPPHDDMLTAEVQKLVDGEWMKFTAAVVRRIW
ncbi:hypothetical protein PFICI_15297 [Pestalotiopsis fici W106-1]|uniref:Uncharacterized protein n=1 Tax=Pestalotiopsis fici (strain W106-1 / CGMCC3.15140) TaxID=1229662 RepID=W3WG57_PESFW|nr:uncharacterized protein PFICI_15297 [Pestalotiopsis fici W106-1]ETS72905.1 hypothetical protein PFICI_15297 [Pestalotiopsis fici W106-1]